MEILLNNLKITRSNIKEWQNTFVNQLNKNILNLNQKLRLLKKMHDEKDFKNNSLQVIVQ